MERNLNVGGQALIEGVLIRSPKAVGIAIRKADGTIRVEREEIKAPTGKIANLPIIRGLIALFMSMKIGINALNMSASEFVTEEDKFEIFLRKIFGKYAKSISIALTMLSSLVITILFFTVFPSFIIMIFKKYINSIIILSIIEGFIKIFLFLAYIYAISSINDVKRVFQYHGAEHMVIFTYESGDDICLENIRKYRTQHPRCGTSFIFFLLVVSIFISTFITFANPFTRSVIKVCLMPIIAGLGFEMLKFTANSNNIFVKMLRRPGIWIQNITTSEPDDKQIEVAVEALKASLK